jgi:hypothetical protein
MIILKMFPPTVVFTLYYYTLIQHHAFMIPNIYTVKQYIEILMKIFWDTESIIKKIYIC